MKIDLHIHTTYSDGVFSPEKVVDAAIDAGLDAIAITDHDNVLSYPIAKAYLEKIQPADTQKPLTLIPGIEINTIYKGYEVHILVKKVNHLIHNQVKLSKFLVSWQLKTRYLFGLF